MDAQVGFYMSTVTWEGINAECIDTHILIYRMFSNYTPANVDTTRKLIDPHLLRCKSCRILLLRCFEERKAREYERKCA
jgi:hypothetical protein